MLPYARIFPVVLFLAACAAPSLLRGADEHWAFVPPRRPALPAAGTADWPRNPIDRFVLAGLAANGLEPSDEADRATLARRVTLALTGLPPTLQELDAFLADEAPDAYERLVARLQASPRYGEHLATQWLDLARYADTHGYHMDAHREMWRWRDGLIAALNSGQPYDQFTIEQLAGDLLPNATLEQKIASGFNRNNMVNFEAGTIPDEFLAEYAAERVAVTSTVWLGLTMQCCRCHDHKYDPFTQRDFYRLFAMFNQVPEKGIDGDRGNAAPAIAAPSSGQQRQREQFDRKITDLQRQLAARRAACGPALATWQTEVSAARDESAREPDDMVLYFPFDELANDATREMVGAADVPVVGGGRSLPARVGRGLLFNGQTQLVLPADLSDTVAFEFDDALTLSLWVFPTTSDRMTLIAKTSDPPKRRGWFLELDDSHVVVGLNSDATNNRLRVATRDRLEQRQWQHVLIRYDGSGRASGLTVFVDGVRRTPDVLHDNLDGSIQTNQPLRIGRGDENTLLRGMLDDLRIFARQLDATEVAVLAGGDPIRAILSTPVEERTADQSRQLREYYLTHHDAEFGALAARLTATVDARDRLRDRLPTTMVMRDAESPRETFVLIGGRYDQPGERVTAGTPAALNPLPDDAPRNRLGLARWLVDERNPLTARVAVNRIWQSAFGRGLVASAEDFGVRGQPPTHPELLDWLAVELIEGGWDVKRLHALIVSSATFRQASSARSAAWSRDPKNALLARGPRVRLSAEAIRDSALATGGLLVEQLGGPPVFPYQPPGLWEELAYDANEFTAQSYTQGHGADLYRRSVYTFWKRSSPPPLLATLGAPSRETCTVRRPVANTPVEALALMNETGLVEAARAMASRILDEGGATDEQRIAFAFCLTTSRPPWDVERAALLAALRDHRQYLRDQPGTAGQLLNVGEGSSDRRHEAAELAAWTVLAQTLLCLDEAITRN